MMTSSYLSNGREMIAPTRLRALRFQAGDLVKAQQAKLAPQRTTIQNCIEM